MKFWQLASLMRGRHAVMQRVAEGNAEWRFAAAWMLGFEQIVREQDREKLDFVLDNRFVRAVLRQCRIWFFLTPDHQLRSRRQSLLDKKLSALRAFDRYGGDALEDAQEYGSVRVGYSSNPTNSGAAAPAGWIIEVERPNGAHLYVVAEPNGVEAEKIVCRNLGLHENDPNVRARRPADRNAVDQFGLQPGDMKGPM